MRCQGCFPCVCNLINAGRDYNYTLWEVSVCRYLLQGRMRERTKQPLGVAVWSFALVLPHHCRAGRDYDNSDIVIYLLKTEFEQGETVAWSWCLECILFGTPRLPDTRTATTARRIAAGICRRANTRSTRLALCAQRRTRETEASAAIQ